MHLQIEEIVAIAINRQSVLWTMDQGLKKIAKKLGISILP